MPLAPMKSGKALNSIFNPMPMNITNFSLGENSAEDIKALEKNELRYVLNFKYNNFGKLETRQGLTTITNTAVPVTITETKKMPVGGTEYTLVADSDHHVYYLDSSSNPQPIESGNYTASGDVQLVNYDNKAIILDGSYIKYWDGTHFKLAYDDGNLAHGYMVDKTCLNLDIHTDLYAGTTTVSALPFTTPTWDSGFTLPVTKVDAWISAGGSPTGNVYCKIYDDTGATVLATSDALDASTLSSYAIKRQFTFTTQYNVSPSTSYLAGITYTGGDSSNYISVWKDTTSGDSDTENYYDTAWHTGTGTPLIGIKPGRPPKASFGVVKEGRLFVAGDPDNPGYLWYSNASTVLDWSTSDGGGYIGIMDSSNNNFPVGGLIAHFGDLYIFGTSTEPYLCKLTGSSPSSYSASPLFQQTSTTQKCLISTINDVWYVSSSGVHALSGVMEYGDVRTFSEGDPVLDKIQSYLDSNAFVGYNPTDGQLLIKLSSYSNVLVCHTKIPTTTPTGRRRFPWVEYNFTGLTPTAFGSWGNEFYIGCSNGHLYKLSGNSSSSETYEIKSGIIEIALGKVRATRMYVLANGDSSAQFTLSFYTDGNTTTSTVDKICSVQDAPINERINFNAKSLQWEIGTVTLSSAFTFGGIEILATPLEVYK